MRWIENGLALVGSPETVIRRMQTQHQLIGYDIFCANHHFGPDQDGACHEVRERSDASICVNVWNGHQPSGDTFSNLELKLLSRS